MTTAWKEFLGSDLMMHVSYTCDALGGSSTDLLKMMMDAESASDFVSRYKSAPIYEDPEHPENTDTYPFQDIIDACTRIEKEEMHDLYALIGLHCSASQYAELLSKIRNKSVEKTKHLLEVCR